MEDPVGDPLALMPATVAARVAELECFWRESDDDESCHGLEDSLRGAVLYAIAHGHPHGQALAIEALKTGALTFARWCA